MSKQGTFYICGFPWTVTFTDGVVMVDLRAVHGSTDKFAHRIAIATDGTDPDKVRATMVHELLHACICTVLNTIPDDEETLVQGLEVAQYSTLRDPRNLWLWRFLFEGVFEMKEARKRGKHK